MGKLSERRAAQRGRKPKDRDFIQTREGMFFCVTGYLHPPDRYTAYLKYSPDPLGKWSAGATRYRRELAYYHVGNVAGTLRYLEHRYPHYVHHCPVRDIRFSMVPHAWVARYYDPQQRLKEIMARPRDPLEEEVTELVTRLAGPAGVEVDRFGVTGSILIGLHSPVFSDIDLLVYGSDNAQKVRGAPREDPDIRPLDADYIEKWISRTVKRFPITVSEARYLAGRRWNFCFFRHRYFSIYPTRCDAEITEAYGEHIYRGRGAARIQATLVDASAGLFLPAVYRVADVTVLDGHPEAKHVREVVSHEGLYCNIADPGQRIEVYGKLETVDGEPRSLVVGTFELQGKDYIKPATPRVLEEGDGE